MRKAKNILLSQLSLLGIGLMVGLALLAQPLAEQSGDHADNENNKEVNAEQNEGQELEFISAFDAIAPIQNAISSATQFFVLDEIFQIDNEDEAEEYVFIDQISEKLTRVLFHFIIAPNAP